MRIHGVIILRSERTHFLLCVFGPWTSVSPTPQKANVRTSLFIITSSCVIFWVIPCAKWSPKDRSLKRCSANATFQTSVRLMVNYYPRKQRTLCGACYFSVHNFPVVLMDFLTTDVYSCAPNPYKHKYTIECARRYGSHNGAPK